MTRESLCAAHISKDDVMVCDISAAQIRAGDDLFGAGRVLRVRMIGGRQDNAVQADIEGGRLVILDREEEVTVRRG